MQVAKRDFEWDCPRRWYNDAGARHRRLLRSLGLDDSSKRLVFERLPGQALIDQPGHHSQNTLARKLRREALMVHPTAYRRGGMSYASRKDGLLDAIFQDRRPNQPSEKVTLVASPFDNLGKQQQVTKGLHQPDPAFLDFIKVKVGESEGPFVGLWRQAPAPESLEFPPDEWAQNVNITHADSATPQFSAENRGDDSFCKQPDIYGSGGAGCRELRGSRRTIAIGPRLDEALAGMSLSDNESATRALSAFADCAEVQYDSDGEMVRITRHLGWAICVTIPSVGLIAALNMFRTRFDGPWPMPETAGPGGRPGGRKPLPEEITRALLVAEDRNAPIIQGFQSGRPTPEFA